MEALATKEIVLIDEWIGCYRGGWKGVIVDDAFSHPAKVAFNLAKRIYEHAIDCGWIHAESCVSASPELVKYIQCHALSNHAPTAERQLATRDAVSAPALKEDRTNSPNGQRLCVPRVEKSSTLNHANYYNTARPDAGLNETEQSDSLNVPLAQESLNAGQAKSSGENTVPAGVTNPLLSETSARPENPGHTCLQRETLESADPLTGNGVAALTSNITESSGKSGAALYEKKLARVNGAEPQSNSKSTTKFLSDTPKTTDGKTSRSCALVVTDELISYLIESSQYSAQIGNLKQLEIGRAITLRLPNPFGIGDPVIVEGSVICDPFGGIGGCAFHGLMNGMRVVTCELEEKFVNLSKQNRELWREKFTGLPRFNADNWIILQGDSRKLASLVSEAGLSVSSPPYAESHIESDLQRQAKNRELRIQDVRKNGADKYGQSEGQLGAMKEGNLTCVISSPPYVESLKPETEEQTQRKQIRIAQSKTIYDGRKLEEPSAGKAGLGGGYGTTEGNLGAMPAGDICITSPPYNPPMSQDHNGSRNGKRGTTPSEQGAFVKYGNTPGQLEGMSMEGHAIAVSSPPFPQPYTGGGGINVKGYGDGSDKVGQRTYQSQGGDRAEGNLETLANEGFSAAISSPPFEGSRIPQAGEGGNVANMRRSNDREPYGDDPNNLGKTAGDTFWSASRTILEQLYSVLSPGAHAIFIVKAFVRDKKIVDFPAQWAQLCESVGFKLIHDHHAMLTEHSGTQGGMFGADKEYKVKRVSFFRRLHEKKSPETAIEYENVLCFERP